MLRFIIALAIVAALGFVYLRWVRPYLKSLPSLADAWATEKTTWAAVKVWLEGRKTILAGMWGELIGCGPDILQIFSGVDLKTAFSLPDNWALLIGGIAVPMLMVVFRAKAKAV